MNTIDSLIVRAMLAGKLADAGECGLPDWALSISGMSSPAVRSFFDLLFTGSSLRYLEVGVHRGSTLMAACLLNPDVSAVGIDNYSTHLDWAMPGQPAESSPREEAMLNVSVLTERNRNVHLVTDDCWVVPLADLTALAGGKFDVLFYDGPHDLKDQRRAVGHFRPAMADQFILVVDDYRRPKVVQGTEAGIRDTRLKVAYQEILYDGKPQGKWWNGLGVFVLEDER